MSATNPSKPFQSDVAEQLVMLDGNNNRFIFQKKIDNTIIFEYEPMQSMFSSTGIYSGGDPVFKQLDVNEWIKLMDTFQNAKAHSTLNQDRPVRSLRLEYQSKTTFDSFTIDSSSNINQELTSFFNSYRQ